MLVVAGEEALHVLASFYTPRKVWAAFQRLPSVAKLCENGNGHIRSTWLKIKQYYKGRLLVEFLDKHGKKKPRYWLRPSFLRLYAICTFTMNFLFCHKPPALWFKILDDMRAQPLAPILYKQKPMHASQFNAFVWLKISTYWSCCYGEVIRNALLCRNRPCPRKPSNADKFLVPHGARRKHGRKQTYSNSRQANKTARR